MIARALDAGPGRMCFELIPAEAVAFWHDLIATESARGNRLFEVEVKPFRKRRSTGKFSQNNHLHGHVRQIAMETGNSMRTVEDACIEQALGMGYPVETRWDGKQVAKDPKTATRPEFALLIDASHILAGDLGIVLREE